jgi:hypothetical protein
MKIQELVNIGVNMMSQIGLPIWNPKIEVPKWLFKLSSQIWLSNQSPKIGLPQNEVPHWLAKSISQNIFPNWSLKFPSQTKVPKLVWGSKFAYQIKVAWKVFHIEVPI